MRASDVLVAEFVWPVGEFERADGEWRIFNVEKCGRTVNPLSIGPDPTRWTGEEKCINSCT